MNRRPHFATALFVILATFAVVSRPASAQDDVPDPGIPADAGPDITVSAGESCDATVTLSAAATVIPEGETVTFEWTGDFPEGDGTVPGEEVMVTLSVGVHEITLFATSSLGEVTTDSVMVTVEDDSPPVIESSEASPNELWPPNHKMVHVEVLLEISGDCDAETECHITSIRSNEPINGRGDGNTSPDWRITGDMTAMIRAERAGPGSGRVYTITVECTDSAGNAATSTATVKVPHDQGKKDDDDDDDDDETNGDHTSGNGFSKCAFKVNMRNEGRNRLKAKLDILPALADLREAISSVAGHELVVEIGDETFSGELNRRGRVRGDGFRARLTALGFLVVAVRGPDILAAIGVDPETDLTDHEVELPIKVTVVPSDDSIDPVTLFDGNLTCAYRQRAERAGKGVTTAD